MAQINSISDLLTGPILPNTIPFFDGCDWISITIPNGITCTDVQTCIDASYVCSFITAGSGINKNACTLSVDMGYVNANIISNRAYPILTIGTQQRDLSDILNYWSFTISDGGNNTQITQGNTLLIQGIDGLRFIVPTNGTDIIQVGLPTTRIPSGTRQAGDVLTWNGVTSVRGNACQVCCDQIQTCMEPLINGLQNQINGLQSQIDTIVGIIGGGGGGGGGLDCTTVLACSGIIALDNRITALETAGYVTCATVLSCPGIIALDNRITTLETAGYLDCTTVLSCPGIIALDNRITTLETTPATITIQDEGVTQCTNATTINFTGAGVTASCLGGVATVNIPGVGGNAFYQTVEDEGIALPQRNTLNFLGTSVTAVDNVTKTDIIVQAYNTIQDEGVSLPQRDTIDFVGSMVTATDTGSKTQVTINPLPYYNNQGDDSIFISILSTPSTTGNIIGPIVPITVTRTGIYYLSAYTTVSVNTPSNAKYIYFNVLVNGNRVFTELCGEEENIGIHNTISMSRVISLNNTDVLDVEVRVATNANGGAQFTISSQSNQPGVSLSLIPLA